MTRARRCYCLRWHSPLALPPISSLGPPAFESSRGLEEKPLKSLVSLRAYGDSEGYSSAISSELEDIRGTFQTLANYPPQSARTTSQRRRISEMIYDVEYRLILQHQSHSAGFSRLSNTSGTLSTSFQLAAQIYIFLALRQVHRKSSIVQKYARALASELKSHRQYTDELGGTSTRSWYSLLLWIETVLAIATVDTQSRQECLLALIVMLRIEQCTDRQEFIRLLKDVAWTDGHLDDEVSALWAETRQMHGK